MKLLLRKIKQYRYYIIVVIALAFGTWYISSFWYQIALIQGASMEPEYHNGQFVVLEKQYGKPVAGEVYAIRSETLNTILIKRVVAVPGDAIIIKDGSLYVNGVCSTDVKNSAYITYAGIAENVIVLSEKEYFVMGDNYEYSKDSRYEEVGCVSAEEFVGRVLPQTSITNK
jgi:signal peptidase I